MYLFQKVASTSFWTLVSRFLGFVRDAVLAHQFGASFMMDAFVIAFKIPNMLRRIFAEGAFTQAFVPIFSDFQKNHETYQTRQFLSSISFYLICVLCIIVFLGILFASYIVIFFAPGFANNTPLLSLSSSLLKIMFVYILLISLTSLASSVLQFFGNFIIPAISPILLNISLITFALLFNDIQILAISVVIGGILQLVLQLSFLKKYNFLIMPKLYLEQKNEIFRIFKNMSGAILSVFIGYISILLNSVFTSFLDTGSISYLYYADRLMELPAGVLGASLAVVLMPSLTRNKEDSIKYKKILIWGLKLCFLLSFPIACFFFIFSESIIRTLFEYGSFLVQDTTQTSYALKAYCLGIVSLVSMKILTTSFYAKFDIKTPVIAAFISVIVTQILNLIFIFYFNLGIISLALSISLGSICNAFILLALMVREKYFLLSTKGFIFILKIILACFISIYIALFMNAFLSFDFKTFLQRFTVMSIVCIIFLFSYFTLLFIFRINIISLIRFKLY